MCLWHFPREKNLVFFSSTPGPSFFFFPNSLIQFCDKLLLYSSSFPHFFVLFRFAGGGEEGDAARGPNVYTHSQDYKHFPVSAMKTAGNTAKRNLHLLKRYNTERIKLILGRLKHKKSFRVSAKLFDTTRWKTTPHCSTSATNV